MKFGICEWIVPADREGTFALARRVGLDGVSISLGIKDEVISLEEQGIQDEYLALVRKYKVQIPALAINAFCDCGMSKKENFNMVKKIFDVGVEVCNYMQIHTIQVPSFMDGEIRNQEELEQTILCLEYGISLCERYGIQLGYENALDLETNLRIADQMKGKPYFIYYDTQNPVRFAGNAQPEVLARGLMSHIRQVHLKDSHDDVNLPLQLGDGNTNFTESLEEFIKAKFDGWYIFESEYCAFNDYEEIIKKDLSNMKEKLTAIDG